MNPARRKTLLSIGVALAMAAILATLAILQYRWAGQISRADRERLQTSLENSIRQFRREFNEELLDLCAALQPPRFMRGPAAPGSYDPRAYGQRYEDWKLTAAYPDLVSNLLFWEVGATDEDEPPLLRWNPDTQEFEQRPWPARFETLKNRLTAFPFRRLGFRFRQLRAFAWTYAGGSPVLISAIPAANRMRRRRPPGPPELSLVLVDLDQEVAGGDLLDDLARRYFSGVEDLAFHVGVRRAEGSEGFVYESEPGLSREAFAAADARTLLLWQWPEPPAGREDFGFPPGLERPEPPVPAPPGGAAPPPPREPRDWLRRLRGRGPVALVAAPDDNWELLARHREGSLDAVVAQLRRRNLAVSFGILLLLGVTMGMILVSTRRAQRLAQLQMDFVAGVSHELRTPLAVIGSAAENLADGVVESPEQVKEYGKLVRDEGRRLAGMVEQTLQFAAGQSGRRRYELRPLRVEEVIAQTLDETRSMIEEAGLRLEKSIAPGLAEVRADRDALRQSVRNLIMNAVKYAAGGGWLGVKAGMAATEEGPAVWIRVEDQGPGIDPADLPYVFDPFYRGREAKTAQIHGTGLGLSLTEEAVSAMGGRVTVKSSPGAGSVFTIHLPALGTGDASSADGEDR